MYFVTALQLPKPMFEFAFEGELLAFIVNGDRFVLLALLPRRKPRTDGSVQPPYHSVKELNLTSSRLLRFACPIWRLAWIFVSSMRGRISTLCGRNAVWGLLQKKSRPSPSLEITSIFEFSRRPPCGGIFTPPFSRGRAVAQFSFSALTSFGRVYVFYSVMRQQVPKPTYAFALEGEETAFIGNGDRDVPLALTPRRKPRTDFFPAAALPPSNQL